MATFTALSKDALHTELGTDDTSVLFTGARRRHAINEGYRQFADLTECFVTQSTMGWSTGVQEIDLSTLTNFSRVAGQGPVFVISDSNGVQQTLAGDDFPQVDVPFLDHAQSGWRSTVTGYPSGWYLRQDAEHLYFGLNRRFDVSSGSTMSGKLVLPWVQIPSSMTASTDVPFMVGGVTRQDLKSYHQGIVHFAAHDLEKLRKDPQASDRQLQKFQGYVSRFFSNMRPKGVRSVRTAVSYFRNARKSARMADSVLVKWW